MKYKNNQNKKAIGLNGENAVLDKLKTMGFILYKNNINYIDFEIDLVVYKYLKDKNTLDIRIIEVKTRTRYEFDLSCFRISKKWGKVRKYIFNIKEDVVSRFQGLKYSEIHFDLALVKADNNDYRIYSYIKDVNLLI